MTDQTQSDSEFEPENCQELESAVAKTGENDKGRQQYLVKRSIELGCVDKIPDNWEVSING